MGGPEDPQGLLEEELNAALQEYMEAVDRGEAVRREEFIAAHPRLAEDLREFFDAADLVDRFAGPSVAEQNADASTHSMAAMETSLPGRRQPPSKPAIQDDSLALPETFGRYRIVRPLGHGAMGAVYLAHDTELDRQVALKVPKIDEDDPQLLERFSREARAAAHLRHPGICPVFDVGEIAGQRYISMAYIEGQPLSFYISPKKPIGEQTAALITRKLALALAHAHQHGVIHRDLKPANIMVDTGGEPLIMDFGLALKVGAKDENIRLTEHGMILGTPAYMSPEQLDGQLETGPATDVYSLGVILYEMLTGSLPFTGSMAAVIGQVMTREPPKPTECRTDLDPRLEAICQKMRARKPEHRYASMQEAAEALAEFLKESGEKRGNCLSEKGQSVSCSPPAPADGGHLRREPIETAGRDKGQALSREGPVAPDEPPQRSLLQRWLQIPKVARWAAGALVGIVLILLTVTLLIRTGHGTVRIQVEDPNLKVLVDGNEFTVEDTAKPVKLEQGEHRLAVELGKVTIPLGKTVSLSTGKYNGRYRLAVRLGEQEVSGNRIKIQRGKNPALTVSLLKQANQELAGVSDALSEDRQLGSKLIETTPPLSPMALVTRPARIEGVTSWTIETKPNRRGVRGMAFHPDGQFLATGSEAGVIRFWDHRSGELLRILVGHADVIDSLQFSHDGTKLLSGSWDGTAIVWHVEQARRLQVLRGQRTISSAWWHNSKTVGALGKRSLRFWNVDTGGSLRLGPSRVAADHAALAPTGNILAVANAAAINLFDPESGAKQGRLQGGSGPVTALAWRSDGAQLASGHAGGTIHLWNAAIGESEQNLQGDSAVITALCWSPDGEKLLSADEDNMIRVWSVKDGRATASMESQIRKIQELAWSPDGTTFASAALNGTVAVWDAKTNKQARMLPGRQTHGIDVAWSPDGRRLAIAGWGDSRLLVWDCRSWRLDETIEDTGWLHDVQWLDSVTPIVIDDEVRFVDIAKKEVRRVIGELPSAPCTLSVRPNGETVAVGCRDGSVVLVDATKRRTTRTAYRHRSGKPVEVFGWSGNGRLLASVDGQGHLKLWDVEDNSPPAGLQQVAGVRAAAWSPDGAELAIARRRSPVTILDVESGKTVNALGAKKWNQRLAWSRDGTKLARVCRGHVEIWGVLSKRVIRTFDRTAYLTSLAWNPDSRRIAFGFGRGRARVCDTVTGRSITIVEGPGKQGLAINDIGHFLTSAKADDEVLYVVQTADGQETLTPPEFEIRYGWQNDPNRVRLLDLESEGDQEPQKR